MYKEAPGKTAFKEMGSGVVDWAKVLRAASAAGVEHYFVEQDQVAEDPVESLQASFRTMERLKF